MSSAPREPLSWLTLERYALGELDAEQRRKVEVQLADSREDRACLESILADTSELPALPVLLQSARAAVPSPSARGAGRRQGKSRLRRWLPVTSGVLAAAAALLLLVLPRSDGEGPPARRVWSDGTKGGEVALALIGEQHGADATHFAQGERFKLLVTCPAWFRGDLRVVLFQAGARYEPLTPNAAVCGNRVPWPGAFALDGRSMVEVCVAWGADAASAKSAHALGDEAVCARLAPQ